MNAVASDIRKLNVLFLSKRFLYPMDTGAKIRTGKMLEKLSSRFEITLVSSVESPQDDAYLDEVHHLCAAFYPVSWTEVKKYSFKFYVQIFLRMFSRYPITVLNDWDRKIQAQLAGLLEQEKFDLLICDFVQSSLNVRRLHRYPTLLFQHNVEAVIARRHYEMAANPLMKLFWWLQYAKMHRYEQRACHRFGGVVAVSELDQTYMQQHYHTDRVWTIPTGIDTEYFAPLEMERDDPSLIFTGSMDWLPNEDAMLFFAEHILDQIQQDIPDIKISVVGRNPSRHLQHKLARFPAIRVVGWVDDVRPHISRHTVYIVPLRIGGGTRIKLYEAMAMGKAVVSTRIGAEGLPVEQGRHVLLADTAEDFARAVVQMVQDHEARHRLETSAREFVQSHCSWDNAAEVFAEIGCHVADTHRHAGC